MSMGVWDELDVVSPLVVAFGAALLLAALAVYNYATGVYGGAIVSGLGTLIATLFGLLIE
jgi:hypothetical protein